MTAKRVLDTESFAALVEARSAELEEVKITEREGLNLRLTVGGYPLNLNLGQLYQVYQQNADRLEDIIQAHLNALLEVPRQARLEEQIALTSAGDGAGMALPPAAFGARVAQRLEEIDYIRVLSQKGLELRLSIHGKETAANLHRYYQAYAALPHRLEQVIESYVDVILEMGDPDRLTDTGLQQVVDRILPLLKPRDYLKVTKGTKAPSLVHRPYLAGLVTTYVIDMQHSMAYVNEDHLARWGTEIEELHELALANLAAKTGPDTYKVHRSGARTLCICQTLDGYDATRILLPDLMAEWAGRVPGRLLLGIPNRDFLIGFSDRDRDIVRQITAQVRRDARERDHGLTDQIFTWQGGEVRVYRGRRN